jgi:hypothetical protein
MLQSAAFLRELNVMVHEEFPGALTLAEVSTGRAQETANHSPGNLFVCHILTFSFLKYGKVRN